jgi:hypothetical protein
VLPPGAAAAAGAATGAAAGAAAAAAGLSSLERKLVRAESLKMGLSLHSHGDGKTWQILLATSSYPV